jgi:hypothetical protein
LGTDLYSTPDLRPPSESTLPSERQLGEEISHGAITDRSATSLKGQNPSRLNKNQNGNGQAPNQSTFPHHEPARRFQNMVIVPTYRIEPARHAGESDRREDEGGGRHGGKAVRDQQP